jgi:cardiolipin synthase
VFGPFARSFVRPNPGIMALAAACLRLPARCATLPDVRPLVALYEKDGCCPMVTSDGQALSSTDGRAAILAAVAPARRPSSAARPAAALPVSCGNAPPLHSRDDAALPPVLGSNLCVMQAAGGCPISSGNRVRLLIDGDAALTAMLAAMAGARDHINVETYVFRDDSIGRRFGDMLVRKRSEGVAVNLIYDAFGCRKTPDAFFDRLRRAGVNTLAFNPVTVRGLLAGKLLLRRTHRKLLIIDGSTVFTGGINIGRREMQGCPPGPDLLPSKEYRRDTDVMIEGPAAAAFQRLFFATWLHHGGAPPVRGRYFPDVAPIGPELVQAVASTPGALNRLTYIMYLSAIAHAGRSIYLTQGYFAPDGRVADALADAARRGVDVRIILPCETDHTVVRQAGRGRYEALLAAGVRLYERPGGMLHAKTAVVDGLWTPVGSTNMDLWRFASDDEVNAVVLGSAFASEMEAAFWRDIAQSKEITREGWRERPLLPRIRSSSRPSSCLSCDRRDARRYTTRATRHDAGKDVAGRALLVLRDIRRRLVIEHRGRHGHMARREDGMRNDAHNEADQDSDDYHHHEIGKPLLGGRFHHDGQAEIEDVEGIDAADEDK